jgi:hypothetical protein
MPAPFARFAAIGLTTLGLASVGNAQKQDVVPASGSVPQTPVRAVAYIHGTTAITREELADFLIARGGYEKVDLLINRKIIEMECAKKGVTVTPQEMEAVLNEDMKGLGIVSRDQFLEQLLPRYNKTYYEWMEDVIKPRLQLKKLCQGEVKVSEDDLKKQFENLYGEKRRVQMVMWPKDQVKVAQEQFAKARTSQEEFDRIARSQANPSLAGTAGHVLPISRHQPGKDPFIEKLAFEMKVGEVSQIIECRGQDCYVVLKLHEIIPPDANVTFESKKAELEKAAFEQKVEARIPEYFAALKKAANPTEPLIGPPAEWRLKKTDRPAK